MQNNSKPPKRTREKFPLRVIKGGFAPADRATADRLNEKGYKVGDIVLAELTKIRNYKFHRLAHVFGRMVAENIESFQNLGAHQVLKRIQMEAGIECDEMGFMVPGFGMVVQKIPRSLNFASMDEGDFQVVVKGMCRWIAQNYWDGLTEDQILDMAQVMVDE